MSGEPKRIGSIINQLLARRGYAQVQTVVALQEVFRSVLGDTIAGSAQAGTLKRGVLEVIVGDAATMQELAFLKRDLLKKLQASLPDARIKDLRFRLGKL